jgi:hypothetical protein
MLFRLFRKPRRRSPARPGRFSPRLGALEERTTPPGGLLAGSAALDAARAAGLAAGASTPKL